MVEWVRVSSDDEFDAYARARNAMFPDLPTSGPLMRASEEKAPTSARVERYLMRRGNETLGAGVAMHAYWFDAADLFVADAYTFGDDPEAFAQIHGKMVERVTEMGARRLRTMVSSLTPRSLAVLTGQGFEVSERFPVTSVDLGPFDPSPFEEACQAVNASGFVIEPLTALIVRQPDSWQRMIWELDMELSKDMPFQETWSEIPFETYVGQFMIVPTFDPTLHFLAMDGDTIAGITMLILVPGDDTLLGTGLTGTRRAYRRRGLAKALKVHAIVEAKRRGFRRVVTENEETNPMLTLNVELGFTRVYDQVALSKRL